MKRPLYISIPAWGAAYVSLATTYTIPATLAALKDREAVFLIHTDTPAPFNRALAGRSVHYISLPPVHVGYDDAGRVRRLDWNWRTFKQAHRDALALTPPGAVAVLLNSDIVASVETFDSVDRVLESGVVKVIASVGIRTLIGEGASPPIGASAADLNAWIWANRHPITVQATWIGGTSHHPTILFFDHEDGSVSMHCWHLTPMFIVKDRALSFKGTIDDDVLRHYADGEIFFTRDREMAFAELSPRDKTHGHGLPLTVDRVLDFGKRRFSAAHKRNFAQRFTVLGNPTSTHPAALEIIARS